jgi:hypothetical protein
MNFISFHLSQPGSGSQSIFFRRRKGDPGIRSSPRRDFRREIQDRRPHPLFCDIFQPLRDRAGGVSGLSGN